MKLKTLQGLDGSIKLERLEGKLFELLGLTVFDSPKDNCSIFIKNRKFLKKIQAFLDQSHECDKDQIYSSMGVIVDKIFFDSIKEEQQEFFDNFKFVLSCSDVDLCMSHVSKVFYDDKLEGLNLTEDGRDLMSANVSSATISSNVFIGDKVEIGSGSIIYSGVTILAGAKIGNNTIIFPNTVIYHNVVIGNHCRIHSGVVIGADGFGYNYHNGVHLKVWHMGGVIIEDDVEIGANAAIDAGTLSSTIIGRGSKIDNLVQVAHNVKIERGVILCGQSGIAGSAKVGAYSIVGGKSALSNDASIGAGSKVAGMSAVDGNWPPKSILGGYPARNFQEWMRSLATLRMLSSRDKRVENKKG